MINHLRSRRAPCNTSLLIGAFVLARMQAAQCQTAEDILNKADTIYSSATSYQATYHWEEKMLHKHGKDDYSWSERSEVKAIGLTKFALHMVADKPKGHKHDDGLTDTSDIYDDGKDHYLYPLGKDYYYRDTHDEFAFMAARNNSEMLDRIIPQLKPRKGFTYTFLAPATVNGKAAYVIEAKGAVEEVYAKPPRWVTIKGHRVEQFFLSQKFTKNIDDLLYRSGDLPFAAEESKEYLAGFNRQYYADHPKRSSGRASAGQYICFCNSSRGNGIGEIVIQG